MTNKYVTVKDYTPGQKIVTFSFLSDEEQLDIIAEAILDTYYIDDLKKMSQLYESIHDKFRIEDSYIVETGDGYKMINYWKPIYMNKMIKISERYGPGIINQWIIIDKDSQSRFIKHLIDII